MAFEGGQAPPSPPRLGRLSGSCSCDPYSAARSGTATGVGGFRSKSVLATDAVLAGSAMTCASIIGVRHEIHSRSCDDLRSVERARIRTVHNSAAYDGRHVDRYDNLDAGV